MCDKLPVCGHTLKPVPNLSAGHVTQEEMKTGWSDDGYTTPQQEQDIAQMSLQPRAEHKILRLLAGLTRVVKKCARMCVCV